MSCCAGGTETGGGAGVHLPQLDGQSESDTRVDAPVKVERSS